MFQPDIPTSQLTCIWSFYIIRLTNTDDSELLVRQPSRGPDRLIDPIWVDTGLKVAEMYLKHRNKAQPPRRKDEVAADNTEKREVRVPPPTPPPRQKIYNYEMPTNPIIPLTQSEGGEQPR